MQTHQTLEEQKESEKPQAPWMVTTVRAGLTPREERTADRTEPLSHLDRLAGLPKPKELQEASEEDEDRQREGRDLTDLRLRSDSLEWCRPLCLWCPAALCWLWWPELWKEEREQEQDRRGPGAFLTTSALSSVGAPTTIFLLRAGISAAITPGAKAK